MYGFSGLLSFIRFLVLNKYLNIFYRKSDYLCRKLDTSIDNPRLDFRELTYADIEDVAKNDKSYADLFTDKKLRIFKRYLESGNIKVYGHYEDDRLCCYGCINFKSGNIGKISLQNDIYLFDDYIHPAFRGRNMQCELINFRMKLGFEMGYSHAWCQVYSYNKASRNNYIKNGFQMAIKMTLLKFPDRKEKINYEYKL